MKHKFSLRYQQALLAYLKQGRRGSLRPARGWGQQALAVGLQTVDLARLHEEILVAKVLPGRRERERAGIIRRAGSFFSEAITPLEDAQPGRAAADHLSKIVEMLSQRTVELAAANVALQLEIARRQAVEEALKKSERHYSQLLAESDRLQQQLRQLSRQILQAQEEERREISRELHDVIAQTLTGINVRLAALAKAATLNTKGLDQNIAKTQKLVEKSVDIVHRFARELRPAVLDDLGLVPALHSFMKNFTARTGVRTHLTAFAGVEQLDTARRTVLFRVAQEALTNVGRHARASRVEVTLEQLPAGVGMQVKDDGKSFSVDRTLHANGGKRLGLLGMRERVEMVGGKFYVDSAPGQGTTVRVEVPFGRVRKSAPKKSGHTPLKCS
jgi:signal transduction histidine kinase